MTLAFSPTCKPKDTLDWTTFVLHDILLQEGCDTTTLLDRIFTAATARTTLHAEPIDPLMYMLGFDETTMPDTSDHRFSSAMGSFFERLVKGIFLLQRTALFEEDWKQVAEDNNLEWGVGLGKRWGDFMIGDSVVELKYRYSSGQGSDDQGRCAPHLKSINKHPVMLVLRPSRNADRMRRRGWDVKEGADAIAWIAQHANIDLRDLATACRENPLFVAHTEKMMARYKGKAKSTTLAKILTMDDTTREELLRDIQAHVGQDAFPTPTPVFTSRRTSPVCVFKSSRAATTSPC